MSEAAIEQILDSGNLDNIDALLEKLESGLDEEEALAAVESGDTGADKTAAADDTPSQIAAQPAPAAVVEQAAEEAKPVVLAKDGVNQIPFSVLEEERRQAAQLRSQLDEQTRTNALLREQLESADIKPKDLPENIRFTPEQIEEFKTYGDLGEAVAVLAEQNAVLVERLRGSDQQVVATVEQANPFANNPDTLRWAGNDGHWGVVESVSAALDGDPAWAGKTSEQRIPEIVRRTKLALGEQTEAQITEGAQTAIKAAQRVAPNSLSDVGGEIPGQTKTATEMLENASSSEVEAFLAKATAGGKSIDEVLTSLI